MRSPQVVILELDGWIAKQLREMAAENRWLIHSPRSPDMALSLVQQQPTVLLVQFEPAEGKPRQLGLIAEVSRLAAGVPVVAVADIKQPDAERAAWTAALFDLGARYVLFPPLTKTVLEDVVSGLMAAAIRRRVGKDPRTAREAARDESVLDLADNGADA